MEDSKPTNQASQVDKWRARISAAKTYREKIAKDQAWERFVKEYQGKYELGGIANNMTVIPINLVFAFVHTEIPRLYFRDPYIAVNPKGIGYVKNAKILEVVINYLIQELNVKNELFKCLLDTLLVGHGWLKFGYSGTFGQMVTAEDVKGKGKNKKPLDEINEFVKSEEIFVLHVPWEDIVFDPTAKDPPYDCHWIAHRIIKPLKSVKESDMYKNTATLKANFKNKDGDIKTDIEFVELWEIHDKDSNCVYVITDGVEDFLRSEANPYEMEGLPFSMLKFNPIPGKPYPLSDIALIEPQIMEKIKLRSMQLNHLKRWNRQAFISKGALSDEEKAKFKQGIDGAFIEVEVANGNISQALHVPQYPTIQAEIFQVEGLIQMDMDTIIGQTQTDRGSKAETRTRTLGEVEIQQAGSLNRSERRKDALEDFLGEVCRKLIQLVKQFQLTPKYAAVTDQLDMGGVEQSLQGRMSGPGLFYTKKDVQGDFDVDVKAGSTIPLNKQNRLEALTNVMQLGPAVGITPGGPVAIEVGKELLQELGLKGVEKAFVEQNMQQQQVMGALGGMGGPQQPPMPGQPPVSPMGTQPNAL